MSYRNEDEDLAFGLLLMLTVFAFPIYWIAIEIFMIYLVASFILLGIFTLPVMLTLLAGGEVQVKKRGKLRRALTGCPKYKIKLKM